MLSLKIKFYVLKLLNILTLNKYFTGHVAKAYSLFSMAKYRRQGAEIGENTTLIECKLSSSTKGDKFYIGENCTITGVTLLGHDASPTIFIPELVNFEPAYLPGARRSYRAQIRIGDNVFIGWGCIVLPGITIGSNVVIGAGSIVSKDVPSNSVAVGNPARVVKDIDAYKKSYNELLVRYPERF